MYRQTRAVGACVTGPSHIAAGQGCDDAFAWRQFGDSALVLTVADGAGSVSGTSAWGSWAATQFVASESVSRNLVLDLLATSGTSDAAEPILRLLFSGALQHVAYHSKRLGLTLQETYTTLVVAVLTPERTWIAEIGDGIVAIPVGEHARTVLVEEKGEHAATDTVFLQALATSPMSSAFRCVALDPVAAVALSTDGLRYQATRVNEDYAASPGFFEAMWRNVDRGLSSPELHEFLAGLPLKSDPPRDDKTLLMAIRSNHRDQSVWLWLEDMHDRRSQTSASAQPPLPALTRKARQDVTIASVLLTNRPPVGAGRSEPPSLAAELPDDRTVASEEPTIATPADQENSAVVPPYDVITSSMEAAEVTDDFTLDVASRSGPEGAE